MDWEMWLNRKYAAQEQQNRIEQQRADTAQYAADTGRLVGTSDANLNDVRAGLLPKESASNIARNTAESKLVDQQAKYFGPLTMSQIGLNNANAFQSRASGGLYGAQADTQRQLNKPISRGYGGFGWGAGEEDSLRRFFSNSIRSGLGPFAGN